jgi:hypothetical protein
MHIFTVLTYGRLSWISNLGLNCAYLLLVKILTKMVCMHSKYHANGMHRGRTYIPSLAGRYALLANMHYTQINILLKI